MSTLPTYPNPRRVVGRVYAEDDGANLFRARDSMRNECGSHCTWSNALFVIRNEFPHASLNPGFNQ